MRNKRPLPIWIVSILFIVVGCVGFAYHFKELNDSTDKSVTLLILFVEILAVTCGVLLLYKVKWARWLAIGWLVFHVILSAFNSIPEMLQHIGILIIVTILLFLRVSTRYFSISEKKF